jgi:hypothetical protein
MGLFEFVLNNFKLDGFGVYSFWVRTKLKKGIQQAEICFYLF